MVTILLMAWERFLVIKMVMSSEYTAILGALPSKFRNSLLTTNIYRIRLVIHHFFTEFIGHSSIISLYLYSSRDHEPSGPTRNVQKHSKMLLVTIKVLPGLWFGPAHEIFAFP